MRIPKYSRGGWLVEGYGSTQAQRPTNQPLFVAGFQVLVRKGVGSNPVVHA